MFERRVSRRFYDADSERAIVEITSLQCLPRSHGATRTLVELLANLTGNPDMLHCDGRFAETIEIKHDGVKWVIKAEAIVPRTVIT